MVLINKFILDMLTGGHIQHYSNNTMSEEFNATKVETSSTVFGSSAVASGFMIATCIIFLSVNILTYLSMRRSTRIPYACKLLTCIICICDTIFVSIVLFGGFLSKIEVNGVFKAVWTETGRICFVVSWLTMTLMSLERMLCLYFPNTYAKYSTEKNIKTVTIATLCTCVSLKLFIRYVIVPLSNDKTMDFIEDTRDLNINMCILGICLFINVLCYAAIFKVVRQQVRRMKQVAPIHWINATASYSSTKSVCCIFTVFIAFHFPLFIAYVMYQEQNQATNARYLAFIFMLIMCGLYPVLYAWRFKECRFHTWLFFSKTFNIFKTRVERMRMEVYQIVPSRNKVNVFYERVT